MDQYYNNIKDKLEIKDLVPNPILIRNKNNIEIINEKVLHSLILEDIEVFMKKLCTGYSFIGSEYKIKNIFICKIVNKNVIEYSTDKRIMARTYKVI